MLQEILSEVRSAKFYAVQADETTDVAHNKQLRIAIWWVDENYTIFEEPIGLVHVPSTDANTLTAILKEVLRCNLLLDLCRGQAYDGAPICLVVSVGWLLK